MSEVLVVGVDEGFGDDLGVLFCLGFCREIFIVGAVFVHIGVDEVQQIVAVRPGGIAQIDHGHLVVVVVTGDGAIIAEEIALGIGCQKAHTGGAGVFEVRVQKKRCLADAGRADHQAVDIVRVHQRGELVLFAAAAEDDALIRDGGTALAFPPQLRLE